MNRDTRRFAEALVFGLTITLCIAALRCNDPDKPIDVGVTISAPCPEAAAPYVPSPPEPYIHTITSDEMVKIIDSYEPSEMSKEEQVRWWTRYHELTDASRLEREALQPPHPHTPP